MTSEEQKAYDAEIERISIKHMNGEILTEAEHVLGRDYLLMKWKASQELLEQAKADEIVWRKRVVDFAFDPEKKKGTERIDLGAGYQLKAVKKINYGWIKGPDGKKVNKDAIETALGKIEETGPAGALIADRLVTWKPDLSLTEYEKLPAELKPIIDAVIVTTEGAPTLEIIPPKTTA